MERFKKALPLAIEAHRGQLWRDGVTPYISHPLRVSALVLRLGGSENQALAALLHDLPSPSTEFGSEVTHLINAFHPPMPPIEPGKGPDWRHEKYLAFEHMKKLDADSLFVVGCEELDELSDRLFSFRHERTQALSLKSVQTNPPANWGWYFKEVLTTLSRGLPPSANRRHEKLIAEMGRQLRQFLELVFEGDER